MSGMRQVRVQRTIKITESKGSAPLPLAITSQTKAEEGLSSTGGGMENFDNGHLVAQSLGGANEDHNIVPMLMHFNRIGKWRAMEREIETKIKTTASIALPVDSSQVVGKPTFTQRIEVFYHGAGEPRIPVLFRVLVSKTIIVRTKPVTTDILHYALHHSCEDQVASREITASKLEKATFEAACKDLGIFGKRGEPQGMPYAALQHIADNPKTYPDIAMPNVGDVGKGYDPDQRALILKFNLWWNGKLKSDARAKGVFEDEEADFYEQLSLCGNRNAPEIDHIRPFSKSGKTTYSNARVVSYAHNHTYLTKKTKTPVEVHVTEGETRTVDRETLYALVKQVQKNAGEVAATIGGSLENLKEFQGDKFLQAWMGAIAYWDYMDAKARDYHPNEKKRKTLADTLLIAHAKGLSVFEKDVLPDLRKQWVTEIKTKLIEE